MIYRKVVKLAVLHGEKFEAYKSEKVLCRTVKEYDKGSKHVTV